MSENLSAKVKFSVVIPMYNKEKTISCTIRSVLEQSYTNFEIIVIDDGSTDASLSIVDRINSNKIKVFSIENKGVSNARNRGVDQAKGEWVCFIDADDYWKPEYLERIAEKIEINNELNCIGTFYSEEMDSVGWPSMVNESIDNGVIEINDLPLAWININPFFTSSIAFRKKVLNKHRFIVGESKGEDLDVWFRIAEEYKIFIICKELVVYRTEQSNSLTKKNELVEPKFICRLEQRIKDKDVPERLVSSYKKYISHERVTLARKLLQLKRRVCARNKLLESVNVLSKRWLITYIFSYFDSEYSREWLSRR